MRAAKPKRSKLVTLSWLNMGALTLWWALINGLAERTAFTTFGLYLPQHPFLLPTILLLIGALFQKKRGPIVFNAATLLVFGVVLLGSHAPWLRLWPANPKATRARIMTWNVLSSQGGVEKLSGEIRRQKPDIVCLQETLGRRGVVPDRTPELIALFPGWHAARAHDVTVLSRWPIQGERRYPHPKPSHRRVLAVTCRTPAGPLDVIVAHISTTARGARYGGRKPGSVQRVIETASLIHQTAQTRLSQLPVIDRALADSKNSGRPYFLAGDFNNPPRGGFNRHLKAQLSDAFEQAGLGSGFTFPAKFPVMRIDYLWLGRGVRARRCFTVPTNASDHRATVADVEVLWE